MSYIALSLSASYKKHKENNMNKRALKITALMMYATQGEVAKMVGVTPGRVHQISTTTLDRLSRLYPQLVGQGETVKSARKNRVKVLQAVDSEMRLL